MRAGFVAVFVVLGAALPLACGARTELFAPEPAEIPGIDAASNVPVSLLQCPDASATLVYVVTVQNEIFSFSPSDNVFMPVGQLTCPTLGSGATPFSMAVNRQGVAFIIFDDGELFEVDLSGPTCMPTSFSPGLDGFVTFGMGFATNLGGPSETLFVAQANNDGSPNALGSIDTTSFGLQSIATLPSPILQAELTGTGDGRLFAFSADSTNGQGSFVAELDKNTAAIIAETPLPTVTQGSGWAFAYWGGDFWLFTGSGEQGAQTSIVTRLRLSDGNVAQVSSLPELIVGAGVSTCAPQ